MSNLKVFVRLNERQTESLYSFVAKHKLRKPLDGIRLLVDTCGVQQVDVAPEAHSPKLVEEVLALKKQVAELENALKVVRADTTGAKKQADLGVGKGHRALKELYGRDPDIVSESEEVVPAGLVERVAALEEKEGGAE